MMKLLVSALILTGIGGVVYSIYLINIHHLPIHNDVVEDNLPNISIVIPAHNEAKTIKTRIKNIAECSYPLNKIEVVIVNDASKDNTVNVASSALECYTGLRGTIISNSERMGVNKTMEKGITTAKNDIVVCTDADVVFETDAVKMLVSKLISKYEIGGVSGDLQPLSHNKGMTTQTEGEYRSVYGDICRWESKIASTFCFNGALYAIKKKAASTLNIKSGAYDAGIALSIIRNGYKTVYLSSARVFEANIPKGMSEQCRQKIRRASRLIRATWNNIDLLWRGSDKPFKRVVLPLRILSFFIVPLCFFISAGLWVYLFPPLILLILVFSAFSITHPNILFTFIIHQFYLLIGLVHAPFIKGTWELVERK